MSRAIAQPTCQAGACHFSSSLCEAAATSGEEDPAVPAVGRSEVDVDVDVDVDVNVDVNVDVDVNVVVGPVPPTSSSHSPGGRAGRLPNRCVRPAPMTLPADHDDVAVGKTLVRLEDDGGGKDAAPCHRSADRRRDAQPYLILLIPMLIYN